MKITKEQAAQILRTLCRQDFTDWYETDFEAYLTGYESAPDREEIIKSIQEHFSC